MAFDTRDLFYKDNADYKKLNTISNFRNIAETFFSCIFSEFIGVFIAGHLFPSSNFSICMPAFSSLFYSLRVSRECPTYIFKSPEEFVCLLTPHLISWTFVSSGMLILFLYFCLVYVCAVSAAWDYIKERTKNILSCHTL